ncbi:MAG TPA: LarC family nickel insertion protein, partial [bacterium]
DKFYSSPLPVNRGWAVTEHGRIPLPAPATMELLKGVPVFNSACEKELITPTGTAILSALCSGFGGMPSMNIEKCGYGAGDYENIPFPDILRTVAGSAGSAHSERMWIVESNIDDMNPQFFETAMEQIFKAGAADIFITPVIMKKGRPGYLLTALTDELHMEAVKKGIFANTTTIGVRAYLVERTVLERKLRTERIGGVPIRFKIAKLGNRKMNEMPEYDDLKNLAVKKDISLKEAYNIAVKTVRNAR